MNKNVFVNEFKKFNVENFNIEQFKNNVLDGRVIEGANATNYIHQDEEGKIWYIYQDCSFINPIFGNGDDEEQTDELYEVHYVIFYSQSEDAVSYTIVEKRWDMDKAADEVYMYGDDIDTISL